MFAVGFCFVLFLYLHAEVPGYDMYRNAAESTTQGTECTLYSNVILSTRTQEVGELRVILGPFDIIVHDTLGCHAHLSIF